MRLMMTAAAVALSCAAWAAAPEVRFKGATPIAASNLSDENGCVPAVVIGRVVKRDFAADEIMMKSVLIEELNGERLVVNVDDDKINRASMSSRADAVRALQILLREDERVNLAVFACGAAGRVLMLDAVWK